MEFIIKRSDGKFWGFGAWVPAYPDAKIYLNENRAVEDAEYLALKSQKTVSVITFYGMNNETIAHTTRKEF